jgi:glycogen debranching enzyme
MPERSPIAPALEQQLNSEFHEPATAPEARPRRSLKHNDTFAVLDAHGDIGSDAGHADGLFHEDTRFISRLELSIGGKHPLLLGSSVRGDNLLLTADLTNPDLDVEAGLVKDTVHIFRTTYVREEGLYQRLRLQNHGYQPITVQLKFFFEADFADIFEVRGMRRDSQGLVSREVLDKGRVILRYEGLDKRSRTAYLSFDPNPSVLTTSSAFFVWRLAPGERRSIFLIAQCESCATDVAKRFFREIRSARRALHDDSVGNVRIETSDASFNDMLTRSAADLHMLMTNTDEGLYPYAGIPWYSTTFGRDGIITALQTLWCSPEIAKGVLKRLAAHQAEVEDPSIDAQNGKILHEMRAGEMAALKEIPFGLYYGSVDATPLFILLAGGYLKRTGDLGTIVELWPNIERALNWIDVEGDIDGDGFVEYSRESDQGLLNQGWKDSKDAIFHSDGELAQGPIALVEVQGYVYAAKRTAAYCAARLGKRTLAENLNDQAEELRQRFDNTFWCPKLGTYILALDGKKRKCAVRSSNAGHALFSGIASAEHALTLAQTLLAPPSFSGWGIRTIANQESRFNPMSYHNGSVWPHDNALIAIGLGQYGCQKDVDLIFNALIDAAGHMELHRLPELFCGFQRRRARGPVLYPVACAPQAWAAAVPYGLLQAIGQFDFDAETSQIWVDRARLPRSLDWIRIGNLRVNQSVFDIEVVRQKGPDSIRVKHTENKT